jgi:hypothetical protein
VSGIARRVTQLLAPAEEPAGPVDHVRSAELRRQVARFTTQTFRGCPAFLESLKSATPK